MSFTMISKYENLFKQKQVNEFFYLTELNPTHRESRIIQKYAHDEQALAEYAWWQHCIQYIP